MGWRNLREECRARGEVFQNGLSPFALHSIEATDKLEGQTQRQTDRPTRVKPILTETPIDPTKDRIRSEFIRIRNVDWQKFARILIHFKVNRPNPGEVVRQISGR
jgi:hypothetical protein